MHSCGPCWRMNGFHNSSYHKNCAPSTGCRWNHTVRSIWRARFRTLFLQFLTSVRICCVLYHLSDCRARDHSERSIWHAFFRCHESVWRWPARRSDFPRRSEIRFPAQSDIDIVVADAFAVVFLERLHIFVLMLCSRGAGWCHVGAIVRHGDVGRAHGCFCFAGCACCDLAIVAMLVGVKPSR